MYFALLARRRMDLYGATLEDFAQVKVKNSRHGLQNPNARFRKETSVEDVLASPVVADPLRLLDICATSDGAAALIVASKTFAEKHLGSLDGVPSVRAVSTVDAALPAAPARIAGHRNGFHRGGARAASGCSRTRSSTPPTPRPASDPKTSAWPRSTTCPPRWNSTGTSTSGCAPEATPRRCCAAAPPPSAAKIPVNPSGGLACFGEAIPAQAIAQVCELTWQLKGQAAGRQVEGATVGITANQGLFGHGSSVIVAR